MRGLPLLLFCYLLAVTLLAQPVKGAETDLYLKNTVTYNSGRYLWTVFVAGDDAAINNISYVEYTLHYSFPKPVQVIKERGTKCAFSLSSNSWGEFEIKAKIVLKNGEERYIKYWLNLLSNKVQSSACSPNPDSKRTALKKSRSRN